MDEELAREWARYSLTRIRRLVDKPREDMTDDELSIFTFASNALAGGDPIIPNFDRGPGHRLCRVCGAEWASTMLADHISGCPVATITVKET
jgi:hypothetical protein